MAATKQRLHLFTLDGDMDLTHADDCWCNCSHLVRPRFENDGAYYWLEFDGGGE